MLVRQGSAEEIKGRSSVWEFFFSFFFSFAVGLGSDATGG